jgi:hypothetical protein
MHMTLLVTSAQITMVCVLVSGSVLQFSHRVAANRTCTRMHSFSCVWSNNELRLSLSTTS